MRGRFIHQAAGVLLLIGPLAVCLGNDTPDPNQSGKYPDAVRQFADNVLKYGRDTYGPKHTPLFVDGLNIHTHEPVKWISPKGDWRTATETEEWVLSNFASQQTLMRTLDGLSSITGDAKYRQAAMDAIRYMFDHVRTPGGLFYWGHGAAYDAQADKVWGNTHCLKLDYPYYQLMWQVDPNVTKKFIEAYWSAHVNDWSNLDFDRIARISGSFEEPWNHEYKDRPKFFKSKSGAHGFFTTGTSLVYAGAILSKLSAQERPLTWSERLAKRYIATRHPKTGISAYEYNNPARPLGDDLKEHFANPHTTIFPLRPFEETRFIYYPETWQTHPWISLFLVGDMLGEKGREFTQWAMEELTAWGNASYRKKDNSFIPILTHGTSIEGYVLKQDSSLGPRGSVAKPYFADLAFFWAYSVAYRTTGDKFMWQMVRDIALGNKFGDIGQTPVSKAEMQTNTTCSHAYGIFGFLELYAKTKKPAYLKMGRRIGDNILLDKFYKGFFVPSKRHIYTRFDCFEPLALLHLEAAIKSKLGSVPQVWPSSPLFVSSYRYKQEGIDRLIIYTLTESSEPPMSLQEAAAIGDINMVSSLLEKGTEVDRWDDSLKKTALQRAAMSGHKDIVELLVDKGARVDAQEDFPGGTALDYAAENGHKEIVELLIAKGADINAKRRGYPAGDTPLHSAVRAGHKDIAEFLIDKGANVNGRDKWGYTPLYYAIWNGDKDMVRLLVDKGADVNVLPNNDGTPLEYAVWNEDIEMAKFFVARGAEFDAKDHDGWTAFRYAVSQGSRELVEFFVSKEADVSGFHGAACVGDLGRVKDFVQKGTDIDVRDEMGWTPLYWAASMGREDVAEFLIEKGADVGARAEDKSTPLHQAARAGAIKLVKLLMAKKADVNATDKRGNTPLHSAASAGHRQVAELLIAKDADVNAKGRNGWTPLHNAVTAGRKDVVELLLAKGADVNAKDSRGRTALWWAERMKRTAIVDLLRRHGTKE